MEGDDIYHRTIAVHAVTSFERMNIYFKNSKNFHSRKLTLPSVRLVASQGGIFGFFSESSIIGGFSICPLPQSTRGQPVWTWAGKEKSYNFDDGFNTNNGKTSFVQFRHMVYKPSEFLVWVSSSSRQMKCYIIWLEESWLLPTTMRVKIFLHGALFDIDDHSQNWLVLASHDL